MKEEILLSIDLYVFLTSILGDNVSLNDCQVG